MKIMHLMLVFLVFSLVGCEKIDTKDNGTLYGSWTANERSASYNNRRYIVDIVREPVDSTIILIRNFYNLGPENEVYCRLKDSVLTINGSNGSLGCSFSGSGVYHKSARLITWDYIVSINGETDRVIGSYTKD